MELELERVNRGSVAILGEVRGPLGERIANAKVSDGHHQTASDELGQFQLDCGDEIPARLMVLKAGHQLGESSLSEAGVNGSWPEFNLITVGSTPLEIRGRLINRKGHGLQGVRIWVSNPTLFLGPSRSESKQAERANDMTYIGVVPLGQRKFPILVKGALGDQMRGEVLSKSLRSSARRVLLKIAMSASFGFSSWSEFQGQRQFDRRRILGVDEGFK
ncbi:MAG: hypothetical protein ACI8TQ_000549 [Planctomycetota bacterium]|jgi:hypothetical protein